VRAVSRRDGEVELKGGVANAGSVVRQGAHVLRPSNPNTPTIHRFLRALAAAGFRGASVPVAVDPDGRERLEFVEGDVPLVPYAQWVQADRTLASIARLLRHYHDAARTYRPSPDDTWSKEMSDPAGGTVVCHNDVCLENVVFREGEAVALLDFDFAAPGRPEHDLASLARMCVPVDDASCEVRFGWVPADRPRRLRLVADAYGLDSVGRATVLVCLDQAIAEGGRFLQRRVAAGDASFTEMWEAMGGMARFDRRRAWWAVARPSFADAMR
jgi:aminoglycoside phosphotransferase (APT) family kinase protein